MTKLTRVSRKKLRSIIFKFINEEQFTDEESEICRLIDKEDKGSGKK